MTTAEETRTALLLDGRYQLGPCIGQGGAAKVYRAEDLLLGRTVAVKLMQGDVDALRTPSRVQTEISVLASLTHPSLVELYDARMEPGRPSYLVMEYVDGPTLSHRLREGALSVAEVSELARDLASALHSVHAAGIVHRDVKPANVLLAPPVLPGGGFRAKLADFGVALLLDSTRVTAAGTVVGTAAYLPPEQIRGDAATPAGDIYSLGLVLIEALTGERAFPQATGVGAVMARLFDSPHVPTQFGDGWAQLLTRMTAAEPAERPAAAEVSRAVGELMASAPVPLAPPVTTGQVSPAGSSEASAEQPERPSVEISSAVLPLPFVTAPVDTTLALPVPEPETREPPGPPRWAGPVTAAIAAAVALLCIMLALWAGGASAAAGPGRLLTDPLPRDAVTAEPVQDPDGTDAVQDPDGTDVVQDPDGTDVVQNPQPPVAPADQGADEKGGKGPGSSGKGPGKNHDGDTTDRGKGSKKDGGKGKDR